MDLIDSISCFNELELNSKTATAYGVIHLEEVCVIFSKHLYNIPRAEIAKYCGNLLGLPGIRLQYKQLYLDALAIYTNANLDIADISLAMHAKLNGSNTVISFDQGFDNKLPGITRREP